MVQSILILGAGAAYDFEDDNKKRWKGRKIYFVLRELRSEGDAEGFFPMAQSVAPEVAKKLKEIPGIYSASFEMKLNDGKPELRLKDVDAASSTPVDL